MPTTEDRSTPRATYGASRQLGDVEYLNARFSGHRFSPHSHPVFAVGTVREGSCRIWHRGTSYDAHPGDLVLINPHDPHSADPTQSATWEYCAVYFSGETARRWLSATSPRTTLRGVVGHAPALAAQLDRMCRTLEHDPEHGRAESLFGQFVRELFDEFGAAPSRLVERTEQRATETVRAYLDAHFAETVRIEQLSDLTGKSPFHLIRSFTREFGMAPYRYLTHVRIARAQEMLRMGRPISDTAFSVGFSDQSHLTKFFRRIVGVPPGVWARAVASGRDAAPRVQEPGRPSYYFDS